MKMRIAAMLVTGAGSQLRKDASEDIHVNWIPALHAGMTESRGFVRLIEALRPVFLKQARLVIDVCFGDR
jgi:hypothetical protein